MDFKIFDKPISSTRIQDLKNHIKNQILLFEPKLFLKDISIHQDKEGGITLKINTENEILIRHQKELR